MPDVPSEGPAAPAEINSEHAGVPQRLEYIALFFGFVLIAGGLFAALWRPQFYNIAVLCICVGLAIILAVFGTRANGTFKQWAIVGAGATAIALYLLLWQYPIQDTRYARGEILDAAAIQGVVGRGSKPFLVGREGGDSFKFVIFPDEIDSPFFRLAFVTEPVAGGPAQGGEFRIECIDARLVKQAMDSGKPLSFELHSSERETGTEYFVTQTGHGTVGKFNDRNCAASPEGPDIAGMAFPRFVGQASAADLDIAIVPKLLHALESGDQQNREYARDTLTTMRDPIGFKMLTQDWKVATSSYRADLGRIDVWEQIIRQTPAMTVPIAEAMSAEQMAYLVQMTGQGDYTLRRGATEVLHRFLEATGWPNGLGPETSARLMTAVNQVYSQPDLPRPAKPGISFNYPSMAYNTTVALDFASCRIGVAPRREISAVLTQYRSGYLRTAPSMEKTGALVSQVISALARCTP